MADPTNIYAIDELKFLTGYNIEPVVASRGRRIEAALSSATTTRAPTSTR